MLPIVSKESGKAHFNAIKSQAWEVEQGWSNHCGDCALVCGERLILVAN